MNSKHTAFGELLRSEREDKELTLRELSNLSGVSVSYLNRLEKGEKDRPSLEVVEKISKALHIEPSIFLNDANSNSSFPTPLSQLLLSHPIVFRGEVLSPKQKTNILKLIDFISTLQWKDQKHFETVKMLELMDEVMGE